MELGIGTAALLGAIQGLSELFPFSSLGLLVILPRATHLSVPTSGPRYLPFLVALHLGTALALLLYFLPEWRALVVGAFRTLRGEHNPEGRTFWLIVLASIPAGILGFLLKTPLSHLFGRPLWAAFFLMVNGAMLWMGDWWHRRRRSRAVTTLSLREAWVIGCFQVLALIPGLSRSGSTMVGGLGMGLNYAEAARFSFLLATPIIFAAALVELPKLHHGAHGLLGPAMVGGIVAGVAAWLSTRFLVRYFRSHGLRTLALVSFLLGALSLLAIR
ncbi:MAG: undecaprenyl-diphosphate phosphatase [Firmicutes bacterium]|nr:undecaprenyl-diphosphate phosphatase [Bacillota bacterium]